MVALWRGQNVSDGDVRVRSAGEGAEQLCTDASDSSKPPRAYYITSYLPTVLDDNTGTENSGTMKRNEWTQWTKPGVPEAFVSFEKQAPTEWELVRWGAGWIWANTLEQVPPRLAANSGVCEGKGYFNDGTTDGCSTRELPAAWIVLRWSRAIRCRRGGSPGQRGRFDRRDHQAAARLLCDDERDHDADGGSAPLPLDDLEMDGGLACWRAWGRPIPTA